jgi:hypothetical protein
VSVSGPDPAVPGEPKPMPSLANPYADPDLVTTLKIASLSLEIPPFLSKNEKKKKSFK